MKKLTILVAVAISAIAVNAASFKWTASNIYGSDGTTKWSGLVTLYATGGTLSEATAVASFTPTTAGTINTNFSSDLLVGGNSYDFYYVIDDGGKTFTSATKAGVSAQATAAATIGFGSQASATQNASNWSSAAIPEPTSGLLMLLGLAGLALKRKHA